MTIKKGIYVRYRGSPLMHGLRWLKDGPDMTNISSLTAEELSKVIEYLDRLVVAIHPNTSEAPAIVHPCRRRRRLGDVSGKSEDMAQMLNTVPAVNKALRASIFLHLHNFEMERYT